MSEYIVKVYGQMPDAIYERAIEEIVRCRDCVGFTETWDGYECERFSGQYHSCEPDGYCAWGERLA